MSAAAAAAGEADVEDTECDDEQTVEDVPDLCASVNECSEMSATSVSMDRPDIYDVTTPDTAGNVDMTQNVSCAVDKPTVTDSTHLNTDTATPSLLSPVSSPLHVVRTLITQDDPLGVFTNTVTSTSSKTATDPRTSRSSDDVVKFALMEEESVLMRRISEDAIGRTSWVAAATDSSLRKCSSLNRLSSESAASATTSTAASQQAPESASSSPRTSLIGGTFRSAASRFASKYREIRESMVPPSQSGKVVAPGPPGPDEEQSVSNASDAVPAAVVSDTSDVTSPEAVDAAASGAENNETVSRTMSDSAAVTTQSGISRLRVPTALYSPLGKYSVFVITRD